MSPAGVQIKSRRACAVTPHRLATEAAVGIMAGGGNAVDGAIAANAVLGVVAPDTCGPGGDLFALVLPAGAATPAALNASGRAGSGVDAAALRRQGLSAIPRHHPAAVTVPGCVDGWVALAEAFGRLPLHELLEPAIQHARLGFEASEELAVELALRAGDFAGKAAAACLYPGGTPPTPGIRLERPELARTLEAVAAGGRDAFYLEAAGPGISDAVKGAITHEDLSRVQAEWVAPLHLDLFGRTAWTMPPNSQGYLTLGALWLLGRSGAPPDPSDPAYWHAQIEAYRAMAWDRSVVLADPDAMTVAADTLLGPERLGVRLQRLDAADTIGWPGGPARGGDTAYLCTIDDAGMGVSLIQSNFSGLGSGFGAGASGVLLHNRGSGFTLEDGHPNELAAGKRPLHTLSPTLWTRAGRLELLLGTRGGDQQPQLLVQVAAHLLAAGLDPAAAQARPRWITERFGPGQRSEVLVESRAEPAVAAGLAERSHRVSQAGAWEPSWGPVAVIHLDASGTRRAAADPRGATASAG